MVVPLSEASTFEPESYRKELQMSEAGDEMMNSSRHPLQGVAFNVKEQSSAQHKIQTEDEPAYARLRASRSEHDQVADDLRRCSLIHAHSSIPARQDSVVLQAT